MLFTVLTDPELVKGYWKGKKSGELTPTLEVIKTTITGNEEPLKKWQAIGKTLLTGLKASEAKGSETITSEAKVPLILKKLGKPTEILQAQLIANTDLPKLKSGAFGDERDKLYYVMIEILQTFYKSLHTEAGGTLRYVGDATKFLSKVEGFLNHLGAHLDKKGKDRIDEIVAGFHSVKITSTGKIGTELKASSPERDTNVAELSIGDDLSMDDLDAMAATEGKNHMM